MTWQLQSSQSYLLFDVHFINDKVGYAVGDRGEILYTNNGGKDWQSQDSQTTECFGGTHFVNESVGWAVAEFGTMLHTKNGGRTWESQETNTVYFLLGVFFVDERTDGRLVSAALLFTHPTVEAPGNHRRARNIQPIWNSLC